MRGEDFLWLHPSRGLTETPPHAWGRLNPAYTSKTCSGNTPTCVGKTLNHPVMKPFFQKHPHMRGEDGETVLCRNRKICLLYTSDAADE